MPIKVQPEQFRAKSRLTAIRLTLLTLRLMENWKRSVSDYDSAMILVAVVAITSERLTRSDLEADLEDLRVPLPPARAGKCNFSSIAAATGINRETVRRKVGGLVEAGFLGRAEDGQIHFPVGILQRDTTLELVQKQLETLTRSMNEMLRDEVIRSG